MEVWTTTRIYAAFLELWKSQKISRVLDVRKGLNVIEHRELSGAPWTPETLKGTRETRDSPESPQLLNPRDLWKASWYLVPSRSPRLSRLVANLGIFSTPVIPATFKTLRSLVPTREDCELSNAHINETLHKRLSALNLYARLPPSLDVLFYGQSSRNYTSLLTVVGIFRANASW